MINDGKDNANREKKQALDCFSKAQFIFTFFRRDNASTKGSPS